MTLRMRGRPGDRGFGSRTVRRMGRVSLAMQHSRSDILWKHRSSNERFRGGSMKSLPGDLFEMVCYCTTDLAIVGESFGVLIELRDNPQ